MIQFPPHLYKSFFLYCTHQGVRERERADYLKWKRYFLDFCEKSLPPRRFGSHVPARLSARRSVFPPLPERHFIVALKRKPGSGLAKENDGKAYT